MNEQPPNSNQPTDLSNQAKPKRNKIIMAIAGVIGLCCCGAIIVGSLMPSPESEPTIIAQENLPEATASGEISEEQPIATSESEQPVNVPSATDVPTNTPAPTSTPVPTATPNPYLIRPGTHLVGTDIEAGVYVGMAGDGMFGSCYWARLKDLSGDFDALIANDNSIGQFYIEVKESDYALETKCEITLLSAVPEPTGGFSTTVSPGAYIVGRDIEAGIYKGNAGDGMLDSCYWSRLKDFSGEFDALLANDNSQGQFYVEVLESDHAIATKCELSLLSSLPESAGDFSTTLAIGTYIVGRDIQAGTYRGEAGEDVLESCYWARLDDLTGSFDGLIANDNSTGQFYVEVRETDFALLTKCNLELVE